MLRARLRRELRTLLGCFLFSEDDVFKRIGVLSGGERNRYALAKMLLSPSNFLLLDEPTNHLDMRAKDVLLEAMADFTGTVVFVSHDRYFIDKLATRVFEIEDGEVRIFPGNYEDYLWRKSGKPLDLPVQVAPPVNGTVATTEPMGDKAAKRVNPMKVQKLKERCSALEADIAAHEQQIAILEGELGDFKSTDETLRVSQLLEEKRVSLEKLMNDWEQVSAELETVELEHSLLASQRSERSDVRDREGDAELVFVSIAEAEAAILHTVSAAIRVVRQLGLRVLHDLLLIVVDDESASAEAFDILLPISERSVKLVGARSEELLAADLVVSAGDKYVVFESLVTREGAIGHVPSLRIVVGAPFERYAREAPRPEHGNDRRIVRAVSRKA